eukprot:m.142020 g.142020  ORF g.142020 m.142020 type:complete len:74 (-) comp14046_c0_seq2:395-616(-)
MIQQIHSKPTSTTTPAPSVANHRGHRGGIEPYTSKGKRQHRHKTQVYSQTVEPTPTWCSKSSSTPSTSREPCK